MKKNSTTVFLVRGVEVEKTNEDFDTDQIEQTKSCIAHLHAVTFDEVDVIVKIQHEEERETGNYYVSPSIHGLCYKAPSEYSTIRAVDTPNLVGCYDMANEDDVNLFLDRLSFYLKQKPKDELDNFILIH